ncbi:uncharacterized protein YraI [Ochrobactrum daejeonense]|uniref:Uncharacterized protein YraI n=1 Tax=Brucella daejeonensis TaxID=659015 RepID=A0A7W9AYJ7_9HYPH|nr:SH3 domain-containing protein [Brucella daejeonensis]MBB5702589.1 uncharacterized protein YraI [Brucella daejeonensis]NKB79158.1 SH3 domain-containing protein [Brucella daejeonensis]
MRNIIKSAVATLAILFATNAEAANAIVTTTVNLRSGPGTQYGSLGSIPNGVGVSVAGCSDGYGWCQVSYGGLSGWASSRYIAIQTTGGAYTNDDNFGSTAASVGIPLIAGMAIGAAVANSGPRYYDRYDRGGWGRGPTVINNGCIGRNCRSYRRGPGPRWNDHPDFHRPNNFRRDHRLVRERR